MNKTTDILQKLYEKDEVDNSKEENYEFVMEQAKIGRAIAGKAKTVGKALASKIKGLIGRLSAKTKAIEVKAEAIKAKEIPSEEALEFHKAILQAEQEIARMEALAKKSLIGNIKDPHLTSFAEKEIEQEFATQKERIARAKEFMKSTYGKE